MLVLHGDAQGGLGRAVGDHVIGGHRQGADLSGRDIADKGHGCIFGRFPQPGADAVSGRRGAGGGKGGSAVLRGGDAGSA
ncbi:hypothetical protein, partial [Erwinia sp. ErVv1]|uniref:hypothetical protein n=1 Tax=Erwinia sp. ErVv1 TaxID=1603299 RepID=UPI001E557991